MGLSSSTVRAKFRWAKRVSLLCVFFYHQPVSAQDITQSPEHLKNVERMLTQLGLPAQVDNSATSVLKLYRVSMAEENSNENFKRLLDVYHKDVERLINSVLGWEAQKDLYIQVYSERLTAEQVQKVESFLSSDHGSAFMRVQAEVGGLVSVTNRHLMEEDMSPKLKELGNQLKQGLAMLKQQEKK